ncbi:Malectin domain [Dillenia turbinata]|uniref:non-specific serine/threonine protein kinase n=1 Tax=Dillenia turbinata TaxID=194707 RepID=A0AAN8UUN4_9MAGN
MALATILHFLVAIIGFGRSTVEAQNQTARLPDSECELVVALREIAITLGAKNVNLSNNPCQQQMLTFDYQSSEDVNNTLLCNCNFHNNTTCHVTAIVLKGLSLPGTLPTQVINLPYLETIDLFGNCLNGTLPKEWASMKLVTTLSLCANNITGTIPKEWGQLTALTYLYDSFLKSFCGKIAYDICQPNKATTVNFISSLCSQLSDNSFNGALTDIFKNMTELRMLFLSGNMLSGGVPDAFINTAVHQSLNINCGGQDVNIKNNLGTLRYEGDGDATGGASLLYMKKNSNWGFSSTGVFLADGKTFDKYTAQASSTLSGSASDLYLTARLAPISLTYFGYCLLNDVYKVKLHFAEIQFNDKEAFNSLGTRIFDVYIQGELVLKNFNIMEEANGTGRPVIKNFNASVTSNTLEIRLYWAGKGTTVIPRRGVYGPLISAISVCPSKFFVLCENLLTLFRFFVGEVIADAQTNAEEVKDHPQDLNPVNHSSISHSSLPDTRPSSFVSPSSQVLNPVNHSSINQSSSDDSRPFSLMSPSSRACYPVNPSSTNQSSSDDNRPFSLLSPSSLARYSVNPNSINQSSLDGSQPFSLMSPSQADDRRPFSLMSPSSEARYHGNNSSINHSMEEFVTAKTNKVTPQSIRVIGV